MLLEYWFDSSFDMEKEAFGQAEKIRKMLKKSIQNTSKTPRGDPKESNKNGPKVLG